MDWLLLAAAGFAAGAINAVAGGGSLLTLPALMLVGLPAVSANATGTAALLPGYVASVWAYRDALDAYSRRGWLLILATAAIGGTLGAYLLLLGGDRVFEPAIPWLMLLSAGLFLVSMRRQRGVTASRLRLFTPYGLGGLALVCAYGGYFNGGLGIILLALFAALGIAGIAAMNGLKNAVSAMLTVLAVAVYGVGGAVHWPLALALALATTAGGYWGARWANRVPDVILRRGIAAVGVALAIAFLLR
ncbi:MAG: hypothetical protein CMN28_00210 [Salinisphaeraceae bacterium]|nr:hypothetical protein [Salinisphaeraceae bacterium]